MNPRTDNIDLPDFESGPFNHLGTSPKIDLPYFINHTKISSICTFMFLYKFFVLNEKFLRLAYIFKVMYIE